MTFWKPPKRFAAPDDLTAEPEATKALRVLRALRHFVGSRYGTAVIELDGQTLMIVKYGPRHKFPEPDPEVSA